MPLITLTTDFGIQDTFVGVMKGVILSIAPEAQVVDLCHEVPAHDVAAAATLLEDSYAYFPEGTIHMVVVDPGVGSDRAALAIRTQHFYFVGPDNGIFDLVLKKEHVDKAVRLTNADFHLQLASKTFHGRDIFAPAAAQIAIGTALSRLGEPANGLAHANIPHPVPLGPGLELHVIRIDRFGNLITDLAKDQYKRWNPNAHPVVMHVGKSEILGIHKTYAEVALGKPLACFNSNGRLEIAVNGGRASYVLNAIIGTKVLLAPA